MSGIETKLLNAAITIAEEGSLTQAATTLHLSQSAVSKQLRTLERFLGLELFVRNTRRLALAPAGEVFVERIRHSLLIQEQAIHMARETHAKHKACLRVGKSPYTDPLFMSAIAAIQSTLFPALRLDIESHFSHELAKRVVAGVLDLAVLTEARPNPHLSTLQLSNVPFYVLFREEEKEIANCKHVRIDQLQQRIWITFGRHVHPEMYDRVNRTIESRHIEPSSTHHVTTAEEAAQLVQQMGGIALLSKTGAHRIMADGLVTRPLEEPELTQRTVLAMRADNNSPVVGAFVRAVGMKLCGRKQREHV